MTKITIARAFEKQEKNRVQWLEDLRRGKIEIQHNKKSLLKLKVVLQNARA